MNDFKQCRVCGESWAEIHDFVTDLSLRVEGYQASFLQPAHGLVMVTHTREHCGNTLAVRVDCLKALYEGPEHLALHTGTEPCRALCLRHNLLEECDADCEMAWARIALQWLRNHQLPPHMLDDDRKWGERVPDKG